MGDSRSPGYVAKISVQPGDLRVISVGTTRACGSVILALDLVTAHDTTEHSGGSLGFPSDASPHFTQK
jgi:hypothetical protein